MLTRPLSANEEATNRLRKAGIRPTPQRVAILRFLKENADGQDATQIAAHALVEGQPIGRTSVARQLRALAGLLACEETPRGETYRLSATETVTVPPTHEGAPNHAP